MEQSIIIPGVYNNIALALYYTVVLLVRQSLFFFGSPSLRILLANPLF